MYCFQFGAEVKIFGKVWDDSNGHATEMAKDSGMKLYYHMPQ